ncbi:MAG TPA: hypothetical protein VFG76_00225, partial [Candidatus Polarisedimenticolia bacterium]|nr:hypothetical protein [Candidatus Polarisedimenticolia bacterium]
MIPAAPAASSTFVGPRLCLLALAVGLASVNTGNNLLYMILALVVALLTVSAVTARRALRRMNVTAHLPEEVACGEPFLVTAEVAGRFPLLPRTWVTLAVNGLPAPLRLAVPVAADSGRGVASAVMTLERRGRYRPSSLSASTGYPLDLWPHRVNLGPQRDLIVLPRIRRITSLRVTGSGASLPRQGAPSRARGSVRAGADLAEVLPLSPEDDARHID